MMSVTRRPQARMLWGATGFTGRLAAEYFARRAPPTLRWAIGGRDKRKLETIKTSLEKINLDKNVDILIGDSLDVASIDKIVEQTKLVLSTVGPFAKYGTPLVESCVRNGTHYIDSTGETLWVRTLIQKYHKEAEEKGVIIIPCCGFDSLPSDLGTYLLADHMNKKHNKKLASVQAVMQLKGGGISGGTFNTMMTSFDSPLPTDAKIEDSYHLILDKKEKGPLPMSFFGYEKNTKKWLAPWIIGVSNAAVVQRSNYLFGYSYGQSVCYKEGLGIPSFFVSVMILFMVILGMFLAAFRIPRYFMKKYGPKPGEGPSQEAMERGGLKATFIGLSETEGREQPKKAIATITCKGDPGYSATARMLAESAMCVVLQEEQIKKMGVKGGILTPAYAMGPLIIERLKESDFTFDVRDA